MFFFSVSLTHTHTRKLGKVVKKSLQNNDRREEERETNRPCRAQNLTDHIKTIVSSMELGRNAID